MKRQFIPLLLIIAVCGPSHAAEKPGSHIRTPLVAKAKLDFRIHIPLVARLSAIRQPASITIESDDVARGYIDTHDATSARLTTNAPHGTLLRVVVDPRRISRVTVLLNGRESDANQPLPVLHATSRPVREQSLRFSYRLYLAPGVQPGTYAWPVSLQLTTVSA